MASSTTNGKTNQTSENIYLPKISSDNNANPNNMRSTGAIPKTKINSSTSNIANGITAEVRTKLNNNVHEVANCKAEINGSCSQILDPYTQNNVDTQLQDKQCTKPSKLYSKSCTSTTNGFKISPVLNGIHNGSICNQLNPHNQEQRFVNTLNRNSHEEPHLEAAISNGVVEPGPSTSRGVNNIQNFSLQQRLKDSESECSSDTGNDDLSCSDECCIYTYKGDMADLPSSFMNLDIQDNNDIQDQSRAGSRGSSPEMDFLEMDFDPGPSCDADSDESSINSDIKSEDNLPEHEPYRTEGIEPSELPNQPIEPVSTKNLESTNTHSCEQKEKNNLSQQNILTNKQPEMHNVLIHEQKSDAKDAQLKVNLIDEPWIPKIASHRTFCSRNLRETKGHHNSSGDLISPNENVLPSTSSLECRLNTSSSLYHSTMEKQLVLDKQHTTNEECVLTVDKTMIWSEQEAAQKQITQIGTSACGATAVLNVLLALGHPVPSNETLMECVSTRLRANFSPLVTYLKSRSVAGTTHRDIIRGLNKITNGQIYARFFHMYPERYINLSQWLSYWIKKGAVPIATLNLQKGVKPGNSIPDAWHHQMLFGVGPHGIYMTNPLEKVEEGNLWHQLSSESVLLVRREDAISRWNNKTNLRELMSINDVRWHKLNVLGQVANVIREQHRLVSPHAVSRTHVTIPAAYSAGITLAINVNNPACEILKHCPELPILNTLP